jgi:branched-chain amino acid transport system substrate-binding protein
MYRRSLITATLICCVFFIPLLASGQTTKPFKIGIVYPLSGPMTITTEGIFTGNKVAVDELNKLGGIQGRRIEFVVRDDQGNPELTTRYCREVITKENVDWVISGIGSAVALAAAAVGNQFKTPTFIFGGHSDRVTIEDWNPYSFRYALTATSEGRMCAKLLKEELLKGIKDPTIYWISWDYEFGHSVHGPLMAKIKEIIPNVKILGEAWPRTGETDYGPFINHILATKPHAIVNGIWGGGVVSLLKQCNQMGVFKSSKLIGMALLASNDYRLVIGKDMPEEAWGDTHDDEIYPDNEGQRRFYQTYRNFIGNQNAIVPSHAASSYWIIHLINAAIKKAKTMQPEAVCKAMEGITIDTYRGPLTVRDFDHQVVSGVIWAPMVAKSGLPYLVLDSKRGRYISVKDDLPTKEEWLAKRKAAGK